MKPYDLYLGGITVSFPWWAQYINDPLTTLVGIGGVILVFLRIWITVKELKKKNNNE